MGWIATVVGMIVSGGYVAYKTGFDDVIYRTIMNFGANFFVYIVAKSVDITLWLTQCLPDLPYAEIQSGILFLLRILATANTFFPVVEFLIALAFMFQVYIGIIAVRITLKLIPGMGG